jgi:hypothetical protein
VRRCLGRIAFSAILRFEPLNIRRLLYKNIESINKSFITESFFPSFNYIDSSIYKYISRDLAYFFLLCSSIYALIISLFSMEFTKPPSRDSEQMSCDHRLQLNFAAQLIQSFNPSTISI